MCFSAYGSHTVNHLIKFLTLQKGSFLFIILSITLHRQLVSAVGSNESVFVRRSLFLAMCMTWANFRVWKPLIRSDLLVQFKQLDEVLLIKTLNNPRRELRQDMAFAFTGFNCKVEFL